ncbi:hypothetical protein HPB50_008921 [Hyalomma asiaticum]|uniref:Uncharacterized protein n=1 Tax=Hyalomma asiaticum TaxID=266040 RepID=A0ACB7TEU2_HYAAI|nr:hypothetical protein HPB50_008921 [Hyalomma asiaticum]
MKSVTGVVLAVVALYLAGNVYCECPQGWFDCGNGRCIAMFWRCDGQNDCGNHKDETGCSASHSRCPSDKFACQDSSYCVPQIWVCDGEADCHDSSDEQDCHSSNCTGYRCHNNECIPTHWRCDKTEDCADASDELDCGGVKSAATTAAPRCDVDQGRFPCLDGQCLLPSKVCDGRKDCSDGADEGAFCKVNECSQKKCSQGCFVATNGSTCYCNAGFRLMADHVSCAALLDSLLHNHCHSLLAANLPNFSATCIANSLRASASVAYLLLPHHLSTSPQPASCLQLQGSALLSAAGCALRIRPKFDSYQRRVFWTDVSTLKSSIHSCRLDGSDFKTLFTAEKTLLEDLSLDWVTNNLYITDSLVKRILVCKIDGVSCSALITDSVDSPRAIIVNPLQKVVYWTDWGPRPAIMHANMDGTSIQQLVSTDLGWPNGLTLDHTTNRLYWCDAKLSRLEYLELTTLRRAVVMDEDVFHPFALAVFEDTVYWSDWASYSLDSSNKRTGKQHHRVLRENGNHIMGVHVYHPVLRQRGVKNPCWDNPCDHICVLSGDSYMCLCRIGYKLSADKHSCTVTKDFSFVLIAEEDVLYKIDLNRVGAPLPVKLPLSNLGIIGALAFDWSNQTLHYSDNRHEVLSAVNTNTFEQWTVHDHIGSVFGMDFDVTHRLLYWVDADTSTLEVCHANGSGHAIIRDDLRHPVGVALYPFAGILFVLSTGDKPTITSYTMDGRNPRVVPLSTLLLPVSLSVDLVTRKLVWADAVRGTIESIDLQKVFTGTPYIVQQVKAHISSVSAAHNEIHWASRDKASLEYIDLSVDPPVRRLVSLRPARNGTYSRRVLVASQVPPFGKFPMSPLPTSPGPCGQNNGGCSHTCLPARTTDRSCFCPPGMALKADNSTCRVENGTCRPHELPCAGRCIAATYWCDGHKDCSDNADESSCASATCPSTDFTCSNGHCIEKEWHCDGYNDCGDSSDEKNCTRKECASHQYTCRSGVCVPLYWRCDGSEDCPDGDDELNCRSVHCPSGHDRCANGQCIPQDWTCDGHADCTDSSDEKNCTEALPCFKDDFHCANGQCLDKRLRCDHDEDCEDSSDEVGCDYAKVNRTKCSTGLVDCGDGQCIYIHDMCDGYVDCDTGMDERNCSAPVCQSAEFFCTGTKRCILQSWLCDGDDDCGDGMDELLPRCHPTTPASASTAVTCWTNEFQCGSHECISWSRVCDGRTDCSDFSDEGSHCIKYCGTTNGGCAHLCRESPAGPLCSCQPGYRLNTDRKSCDDIDECATPGHCSHFCQNSKGSFKCTCADGYALGADRRYCKVQYGEAFLLFMLPNQIRSFSMHGHAQHLLAEDSLSDMHGMDYRVTDKSIFWTEMDEGVINVMTLGNGKQFTLLEDIHKPYHIAVDWVAGNIYFTDGWVHIQACEPTFKHCTDVLDTTYSHLNTFALSANDGLMFWAVWHEVVNKDHGLIERSNMDGTARAILLTDKILWPCSITTDAVHKRIYWSDANKNVIESATYDGKERCLDGFTGPSCADAVVISTLPQKSNSSSTALAAILVSILCVALLVLGYVLYRRNRQVFYMDKFAALDFSVSFKKPTFGKREGLLEDEHPIAADEDYHTANPAPGFMNPAFDTRKTQLLPDDGEFKRWASSESLQSSSSKDKSTGVLTGESSAKQDQVFFFRKH